MTTWLASTTILGFTDGQVVFAVVVGVVTFLASLLITGIAVVRLPFDYFARDRRPLPFAGSPHWVRIGARVGENVLGVMLVVAGVLMSLPGVPGQGFLTILLGMMLIDLPGKRRFELALVRRPAVNGAIDRLRARFGKPPMFLPPVDDEQSPNVAVRR
ncbi:MAG: hypothetical protein HOW73_09305 [Polyangiaceae bacterium]|nr:hypothetical protein [Polyangiaceae bacterium]